MRFALRSLLKHPGFTILAVITLAAGLGSVTALATLADAILFHPLPVSHPSGIVRVFTVSEGQPLGLVSYPDFDDFRRAAHTIGGLIAQSQVLVAMGDSDAPAQVHMGLAVTPDYFDVLGVAPAAGRAFFTSESRAPVVMLAYSFWDTHYGRRRDVLGRTVLLGGSAFTVIGVAPRDFGLDRFAHEDFYIPMGVYAAGLLPATGRPLEERGRRYLNVYGRLNPGFTVKQAAAEFAILAGRLETAYPATNRGRRALLLNEFQARTRFDRTMPVLAAVLVGVAALILAIALANVTGLLLVRADARAREVAVRLAVGASHATLFRESLIESFLLTAGGAVLALPLAWAALQLLTRIATLPSDARFAIAPHFDARIGAILLSVFALVAMLCGGAPVLAGSRTDLTALLKSRAHGSSVGSGRWRRALVIGEIALASALIACGGILVQAIAAAGRIDLGYRTAGVLTLALDPAQLRFPEAKSRAYYDSLLHQLTALPGVNAAALAQSVPLGYSSAQRLIELDGQPDPPAVWMNIVSNDYFSLMRLPLVAGRGFDSRDTAASQPVVVVNEELAKQCGVGARIRMSGRVLQVIGVAKNARYFRIGETPRPYFYLPFSQNYASRMFLHVLTRRSGDAPAILAAAHLVDPAQPVSEVRWLGDYLTRGAMFNARIALQVVGGVGLCGLALALAGLYGVIARIVALRRREIGLRIALGAKRTQVAVMIVWQGGGLVVAGATIGLGVAVGIAKAMAGLVAGAGSTNPVSKNHWILAAAGAFVTLVGLAACLIPALKASAIDPARTLREE